MERRERRRSRRFESRRQRAEDRARRLADRAARRARDRADAIEDFVEEMADGITRRTEEWIDQTTQHLRETTRRASGSGDDEGHRGRRHRRARRSGERAERHRKRGRRGRAKGGLYRDPDAGKVCGVCAGFAEYFDVETWQVRLGAILGLVFIPQLTVAGYFIAYFLMDKKPYYRRVTDRIDGHAAEPREEEDSAMTASRSKRDRTQAPTTAQSLRSARGKFEALEARLRSMESHVTSSRFELQREFRKISEK